MEKLQIYSQCSSRTQHKPWGLGGDNNGLKVHSSTTLQASVLSTSFTLPVPLPAHANARAHTQTHQIITQNRLRWFASEHSSACTHCILRRWSDKGRERAHTHAPTRRKTQGIIMMLIRQKPTNQPPQQLENKQRFRAVPWLYAISELLFKEAGGETYFLIAVAFPLLWHLLTLAVGFKVSSWSDGLLLI